MPRQYKEMMDWLTRSLQDGVIARVVGAVANDDRVEYGQHPREEEEHDRVEPQGVQGKFTWGRNGEDGECIGKISTPAFPLHLHSSKAFCNMPTQHTHLLYHYSCQFIHSSFHLIMAGTRNPNVTLFWTGTLSHSSHYILRQAEVFIRPSACWRKQI